MHAQGTKVEGTIARLFEGHMHMFIECIGVDVRSTRRESYMDLQLDVKGARNIYDSFDKYCEVEVMDGQNQYKTDDHGLQVRRCQLSQSRCWHADNLHECCPCAFAVLQVWCAQPPLHPMCRTVCCACTCSALAVSCLLVQVGLSSCPGVMVLQGALHRMATAKLQMVFFLCRTRGKGCCSTRSRPCCSCS